MRKTVQLMFGTAIVLAIAGCSGEAQVSAEEEARWKNPPPAKPPTAEQLKNSQPGFVGEPQSTPIGPGGSAPPGGGPPAGATPPSGPP